MDFFCILSALLFFFGNLLKLIYYRKERNRNEVTWEEYKTLDPAIIDIEWEFLSIQIYDNTTLRLGRVNDKNLVDPIGSTGQRALKIG